MKAFLKNYRQSPRKVRLVAKSVVGKSIPQALAILGFMPKRAADPIKKLVSSALANAKQAGLSTEDLIVKNIEVNKGVVLKRIRPRARGSAFGINKRTSHVLVTLGSRVKKSAPKTEEKPKLADMKKPEVKKPANKKVVTKKVAKATAK